MGGAGFRALHPFVCFVYYAGMALLGMLLFHPVFLLVGWGFAALVNFLQDRGKELRKWLRYYVLFGLFIVAVNALITHRGRHMLFYLFDQPVTLEAIVYGATMALSLMLVLTAFVSYNLVVTQQKFMYMFSRFFPKGALLVAMAAGFVPKLRRRLQQLSLVQRTRGISVHSGKLGKRVRDGMKLMQMLLNWSLEDAVQTADSMNARGYGTGERSAYYLYAMRRRDWIVLAQLAAACTCCIVGWSFGYGRLTVYPRMEAIAPQGAEWLVLAAFGWFALVPAVLDGKEELRWRRWRRSI